MVEKARTSASSHLDDQESVTLCAEDADETMTLLGDDSFDAVVVNMGFHAQETFELIRRMRAAGNDTPILALTGLDPRDRIKALTLGADDAASLPIVRSELRARLASILRRRREAGQTWLQFGMLRMCLATRQVSVGGTDVRLTGKEFDILEVMIQRRGTIVTKAGLLHQLYKGGEQPDAKILDVLICRLRKKLEHAGAPNLIGTVWGRGFVVMNTPLASAAEERLAA
ncbi:MAG TPA: response regulator transcription factor [Rhodopila sp.]|uniref:response regulator transcription factor n=1 Tax=Rhodopila sp. TaxID=2480087 RepID=UPI002B711952|nr:response regulator transcription factor [Rhodopila sp.]HVY15377.1 response regulator transcription factor [Rhodopila sp.]